MVILVAAMGTTTLISPWRPSPGESGTCNKCDLFWIIQRAIWIYLILVNNAENVRIFPLLGNGGHFLRLSIANPSISGKRLMLENVFFG